MKPLIRKKIFEVAEDLLTGQNHILDETHEERTLSDEDSVDTVSIHKNIFLSCGCNSRNGIGGRCYDCRGISCPSCHGQCDNCKKPICLEHSVFVQEGHQDKVRFCRKCFDALSRKKKLTKAVNLLLSPFIENKNE